jgi:WD40 repeat protein
MTPERWERVKELFEAASGLDPKRQDAFISKACEDEEIRAEVKSLLSEQERLGSFLKEPMLASISPLSAASTQPPRNEVALSNISARYEAVTEVGHGGMGTVYRARDRETKEGVALKILRPEIASDEREMDRFKNEVRLAHQITHKNVCRIHEFNRVDGIAYISMEFVDGENLREIIDRFGSLSVRKCTQIAQQICAGLREAHAQGIVHRDLKPENVMLDRTGQVKVMDFGIARSIDARSGTTGLIVGTPAYMAPEQAQGRAVDPRSDIYSLGLIVYEMLSGRPAFSGDTPVAVALKQVHERPTPLHELDPTIPEDIEIVILKCLEKDPGKRFQSVEELQAALGRVQRPLDRYLTRARQESNILGRVRLLHVPPRLFTTGYGFAGGLALGIALLWAFTLWNRSGASRNEGSVNSEISSPKSAERTPAPSWHEDVVTSVAFSPDGRLLATASEDKTVKLWQAGTWRNVQTIIGHTRAVSTVAFSPDGRWLASGSVDKTIRIWDVPNGNHPRLLDAKQRVSLLAFNSDGSRLASGGGSDGKITVWDLRTGRKLLAFVADNGSVGGLAFSPDGRLLATGGEDEVVKVWKAFTGAPQLIAKNRHSDEINALGFSRDGRWIASASYDKTIKLWDKDTGEELRTLMGHEDSVNDVAFSPTADLLASASADRTVRIWDLLTGETTRVLKGSEDSVASIAFSPDGHLLACAVGKTVEIWDVQQGRRVK